MECRITPFGFRIDARLERPGLKTDRDWLEQYLDGDERAFALFYERHRRAVFACLLALVPRRETAEELLQETFLALVRTLSERPQSVLTTRTDLRPYLLRAARHRAIDHLRRRSRERRALEEIGTDRWLDAEPPPECPLGREEIEALLARLPPEQRETVLLRALGDLTFREIAELTLVPENTAVARFRYAVGKLRDWLGAGRGPLRAARAVSRTAPDRTVRGKELS